MSRFFKSAAFPILIVLVLAFFASRLIANSNEAPKTSFNTFLTQLSDGQVRSATIRTKDNSVEVTLDRADKNRYTTGVPLQYQEVLVNNLRQSVAEGKLRDFDVKPARTTCCSACSGGSCP